MQSTAAAARAKTRGQRTIESIRRRALAGALTPGQVFTLESADDPQGFAFWLAVAEGPSFLYFGPTKTEDGVVFKSGGYSSCATMIASLRLRLQFSN